MQRSLADLRVLVAEDESLVALDVECMLQDLGCQVVGPVASVEEAAERAATEKLDAAILDVNLRGQRSYSIAEQLVSRGIPVILASGYDDAKLFPENLRSLPRLMKPYDEGALAQAVAAALTPAQ
ncbi:response regulator [Arenibaculum pallidiluteum]|uniref:response regulator n=1 Tax=Arenibaculum pallidiluteum TaxID=2812559 RepID=UPI001A973CE6|nr:response regulator [Arenibaculum pallidiluteum]